MLLGSVADMFADVLRYADFNDVIDGTPSLPGDGTSAGRVDSTSGELTGEGAEAGHTYAHLCLQGVASRPAARKAPGAGRDESTEYAVIDASRTRGGGAVSGGGAGGTTADTPGGKLPTPLYEEIGDAGTLPPLATGPLADTMAHTTTAQQARATGDMSVNGETARRQVRPYEVVGLDTLPPSSAVVPPGVSVTLAAQPRAAAALPPHACDAASGVAPDSTLAGASSPGDSRTLCDAFFMLEDDPQTGEEGRNESGSLLPPPQEAGPRPADVQLRKSGDDAHPATRIGTRMSTSSSSTIWSDDAMGTRRVGNTIICEDLPSHTGWQEVMQQMQQLLPSIKIAYMPGRVRLAGVCRR